MSDLIMGGVESGTPLETKDGTEDMAKFFQSLMSGDTRGIENFQRLGSQSFANLFGVTPDGAGTSSAIKSMLANPADRTKGLFSSMRPFEQRATNEAVSGTRAGFGTMGGRFSTNASNAEARVRGELGQGFARSREEALLAAEGQRAGFLTNLFQLANENLRTSMAPIEMMGRFFQPGAPIHKEGLLPSLISAAGSIYAGRMFGGDDRDPGAGGVWNPAPTPGVNWPTFPDRFPAWMPNNRRF